MIGHLPLAAFTEWLARGERGLSSEAIVTHLTGTRVGRPFWPLDHPRDAADFRRCELLLDAVPVARLAFDRMREVSPEWDRLVKVWDEAAAALKAEDGATVGQIVRCAIYNADPCATCSGAGRVEPCPACKGTGRRGGGRCRARGCFRGYHLCSDCAGAGYKKRAVT